MSFLEKFASTTNPNFQNPKNLFEFYSKKWKGGRWDLEEEGYEGISLAFFLKNVLNNVHDRVLTSEMYGPLKFVVVAGAALTLLVLGTALAVAEFAIQLLLAPLAYTFLKLSTYDIEEPADKVAGTVALAAFLVLDAIYLPMAMLLNAKPANDDLDWGFHI